MSEEEKKEGILSTTLREITVLSQLKGHPNIVEYYFLVNRLKSVHLNEDYSQYIVLEYVQTDLKKLLS